MAEALRIGGMCRIGTGVWGLNVEKKWCLRRNLCCLVSDVLNLSGVPMMVVHDMFFSSSCWFNL
jgi:hypothetical protein